MSGRVEPTSRRGTGRIRRGLRRRGLVRLPRAVRELVRGQQVRFTEGNAVTLYETGRAGIAAMLEAISHAREFIHLESYIFRTDTTGRRFLDLLTERARAGVRVRLLCDGLGSRELGESDLAELRSAGGEALIFNPIRFWPGSFSPRRRTHRKILVVDGVVGFTGGLNIGDEYDRGLEPGGWRDTHVRVEGPAVCDLAAVFLESWFRGGGSDLDWTQLLRRGTDQPGEVRCAVLADGPVYRRRRMRDLIVSALDESQHRARLQSPYFLPDRKVLDALSAAGERGVETEIVLAGDSDHPFLLRAARAFLPRLVDAGVRVLAYEGWMMHAKAAVFDTAWVIVGTSNLDRQSFNYSFEVNLVLEGGGVAEQMKRVFDRDRAQSRPYDRTTLARRGLFERLYDGFAGFVVRWFV